MSSNRVNKTEEQIGILEKFYQEGMTSYGRDNKTGTELIEKAVSETGLTEMQVKNWITGKKKRNNPKEKILKRKPRGYDLYRKEFIDENKEQFSAQDYIKAANNAWIGLSSEEKEFYNEKAKEIPETTFEELSEDGQKRKISFIRKEITDLCHKLSSYGVISVVMDIDPDRTNSEVNVYGSERGVDFIQNNSSVMHQFSAYHIPGYLPSKYVEKPIDENALRCAINKKIYEASKGKWTRFPYGRYEKSPEIIDVQGLPDFCKFKNPSKCSRAELCIYMENLDKINFTVNDDNLASKASVTESDEPTFESATTELVTNHEFRALDMQDIEASGSHNVETKRRKISQEAALPDECDGLGLQEIVPSRSNMQVTFQEVLEKAELNEGYVDFINSNRKRGEEEIYQVKWIGYRSMSWEICSNIPAKYISDYWIAKHSKDK